MWWDITGMDPEWVRGKALQRFGVLLLPSGLASLLADLHRLPGFKRLIDHHDKAAPHFSTVNHSTMNGVPTTGPPAISRARISSAHRGLACLSLTSCSLERILTERTWSLRRSILRTSPTPKREGRVWTGPRSTRPVSTALSWAAPASGTCMRKGQASWARASTVQTLPAPASGRRD